MGPTQKFDCTNKAGGFYPNPMSSTSYFICAGTQSFEVQCAPGLKFNSQTNFCESTTTTTTTTTKSTTQSLMPTVAPQKTTMAPQHTTMQPTQPNQGMDRILKRYILHFKDNYHRPYDNTSIIDTFSGNSIFIILFSILVLFFNFNNLKFLVIFSFLMLSKHLILIMK